MDNALALEGVRVLDFSRFGAAPYCGMLLGDMGAEVIRVERPGGAVDRTFGYLLEDGESHNIKAMGRNKKGITLDLRSEEGKKILNELVKKSDVVLDNAVPGSPDSKVLAYSHLREVNPKIIVAAITAYGQEGPYAGRAGMDATAVSVSGATWLNGFPDGPPLRQIAPYIDLSTGTMTAFGIMCALRYRDKTGVGQMIDASLLATCLSFLQGFPAVVLYTRYGELRQQVGNSAYASFGDAFEAKDSWVMIMVPGDDVWRRFIKKLGRGDMLEDPKFQNDMGRFDNRHLIKPMVSEWVAQRTVNEVIAELDEAHVPVGRMNTVAEMVNDPQVKYYDMVTNITYPNLGPIPVPRTPLKLSESPASIRTLAPTVGEHNEEIYCGLLGFSQSKLKHWRDASVI